MVSIIIKSEERQAHEASIRRSFGVEASDAEGRDACEVIAARTQEALEMGKHEGGKRSWS